MVRLFFLLSGEHPSLPFSELESIFAAEGIKCQILERLTQVLRADVDIDSSHNTELRSAMTRIVGLELFNCDAVLAEIVDMMHTLYLENLIKPNESFAVRVKRVQGSTPQLVRAKLERTLGELILKKVRKAKVNLKSPQKTFFGVLTENRFIFGLKKAEIPTKPFFERSPQRRPFFHPTAMSAKLARCMVNLAHPRKGELVLDPFCGTASLLIEAGLIGCRVLGFDVQLNMIKGSLRNLLHFGVRPEGMIVADAKHLPITEIDCVATDPPYGRSATTLGWPTRQIVESFLSTVGETLPRGRRICIASPKSIDVGEIGRDSGFKHLESHLVYVHRSLTREIAVFERI